MRKKATFWSVLLTAMLWLTASAAAQNTFGLSDSTPENGSTVEAPVSSITLMLDGATAAGQGIDDFAFGSNKTATLTKDGSTVATWSTETMSESVNSSQGTLTLNCNITDPGAYVLTLPAGFFTAYDDEAYSQEFQSEEITVSFTVGDGGGEATGLRLVSSDPANGAELDFGVNSNKLTLTFSEAVSKAELTGSSRNIKIEGNKDSGYFDVSYNWNTNTPVFSNDNKTVEITFSESWEKAGVYTISIPAGIVETADGTKSDAESIQFTIKPSEVVYDPIEIESTVPAADSTVEGPLETLSVTFAANANVVSYKRGTGMIRIGQHSLSSGWAWKGTGNTLTCNPFDEIESGEVAVTIPEGAFVGVTADGTEIPCKALSFSFTVEKAGPAVELPTDAALTVTTPAPGTEFNEGDPLQQIVITGTTWTDFPDATYMFNGGALQLLKDGEPVLDADGDPLLTRSLSFRSGKFTWKFMADPLVESLEAGTYTIAVPASVCYFDENDPSVGTVAIPSFTSTFTVKGSAPAALELVSSDPADGATLAEGTRGHTFTLTFNQPIQKGLSPASSVIRCVGPGFEAARNWTYFTPEFSNENKTVTITFMDDWQAPGAYTITIPAGIVTVKDNASVASEAITINFTIDGPTGPEAPEAVTASVTEPAAGAELEAGTELSKVVITAQEFTDFPDAALAYSGSFQILKDTEEVYSQTFRMNISDTNVFTVNLVPAVALEEGNYTIKVEGLTWYADQTGDLNVDPIEIPAFESTFTVKAAAEPFEYTKPVADPAEGDVVAADDGAYKGKFVFTVPYDIDYFLGGATQNVKLTPTAGYALDYKLEFFKATNPREIVVTNNDSWGDYPLAGKTFSLTIPSFKAVGATEYSEPFTYTWTFVEPAGPALPASVAASVTEPAAGAELQAGASLANVVIAAESLDDYPDAWIEVSNGTLKVLKGETEVFSQAFTRPSLNTTLTLATNIEALEEGDYTIQVPALNWYPNDETDDNPVVIPAFTSQFKVVAAEAPAIAKPVSTPAEGDVDMTQVEDLWCYMGDFTFTSEADIRVVSTSKNIDMKPLNADGSYGSSMNWKTWTFKSSTANSFTLQCSAFFPFQRPTEGKYALIIPENYFTVNGTPNPEFVYVYNFVNPNAAELPEFKFTSFVPADGSVVTETVRELQFNFEPIAGAEFDKGTTMGLQITIDTPSGDVQRINVPYAAFIFDDDNAALILEEWDQIDPAKVSGTYTVHLPEGMIVATVDGTQIKSPAAEFSFSTPFVYSKPVADPAEGDVVATDDSAYKGKFVFTTPYDIDYFLGGATQNVKLTPSNGSTGYSLDYKLEFFKATNPREIVVTNNDTWGDYPLAGKTFSLTIPSFKAVGSDEYSEPYTYTWTFVEPKVYPTSAAIEVTYPTESTEFAAGDALDKIELTGQELSKFPNAIYTFQTGNLEVLNGEEVVFTRDLGGVESNNRVISITNLNDVPLIEALTAGEYTIKVPAGKCYVDVNDEEAPILNTAAFETSFTVVSGAPMAEPFTLVESTLTAPAAALELNAGQDVTEVFVAHSEYTLTVADEKGTQVTAVRAGQGLTFNGNIVTVTLPETLKAGRYTLSVPAETFSVTSASGTLNNPALSLPFMVLFNYTEPVSDPAAGNVLITDGTQYKGKFTYTVDYDIDSFRGGATQKVKVTPVGGGTAMDYKLEFFKATNPREFTLSYDDWGVNYPTVGKTYTVTLPKFHAAEAASDPSWTDANGVYDDSPAYTFEYTFLDKLPAPTVLPIASVVPAEGANVEAPLKEVAINFGALNGYEYTEGSLVGLDQNIGIYPAGSPDAAAIIGANKLVFSGSTATAILETPIEVWGNYELRIPAGLVAYVFDAENEEFCTNEALTVNFTIIDPYLTNGPVWTLASTEPAANAEVGVSEALDQIKVNFNELRNSDNAIMEINVDKTYGLDAKVTVMRGNEVVATIANTNNAALATSGSTLTIKLTEPLTNVGDYTVKVDKGLLRSIYNRTEGADGSSEIVYSVNEAVEFGFKVFLDAIPSTATYTMNPYTGSSTMDLSKIEFVYDDATVALVNGEAAAVATVGDLGEVTYNAAVDPERNNVIVLTAATEVPALKNQFEKTVTLKVKTGKWDVTSKGVTAKNGAYVESLRYIAGAPIWTPAPGVVDPAKLFTLEGAVPQEEGKFTSQTGFSAIWVKKVEADGSSNNVWKYNTVTVAADGKTLTLNTPKDTSSQDLTEEFFETLEPGLYCLELASSRFKYQMPGATSALSNGKMYFYWTVKGAEEVTLTSVAPATGVVYYSAPKVYTYAAPAGFTFQPVAEGTKATLEIYDAEQNFVDSATTEELAIVNNQLVITPTDGQLSTINAAMTATGEGAGYASGDRILRLTIASGKVKLTNDEDPETPYANAFVKSEWKVNRSNFKAPVPVWTPAQGSQFLNSSVSSFVASFGGMETAVNADEEYTGKITVKGAGLDTEIAAADAKVELVDGNYLLTIPATGLTAGKLTVEIPAGFLYFEGTESLTNTEALTAEWNFYADQNVTVTPDPTQTVEALQTVTITFDDATAVTIAEGDIVLTSAAGQVLGQATVSVDGNTVTLTIPTAIDTAGDYVLTIPTGAFTATIDGEQVPSQGQTLNFHVGKLPAKPAVTPAEGQVLLSEGLQNLTFTTEGTIDGWNGGSMLYIFPVKEDGTLDASSKRTYDRQSTGVGSNTFSYKGYVFMGNFELPEGKWAFVIPAGVVTIDGEKNPEWRFDWELVSKIDLPEFEYALDPESGSELRKFDEFLLSFGTLEVEDVTIDNTKKATLALGEDVVDVTVEKDPSWAFSEAFHDVVLSVENRDMWTAGEWTLTIPAGMFKVAVKGGEITNEEDITATYTIMAAPEFVVLPDPEAALEELSEIVVAFPEAESVLFESAANVTLTDPDGNAVAFTTGTPSGDYAEFAAKGVMLTLNEKATAPGKYTLTIGGNTFQVDDYYYGGTITAEFTITVSSVKMLGLDGADNYNVYNVNGVCVLRNATAADVELLDAGIYVINGKKVVIRK